MIRGLNTINTNMNLLQKKQENISNNIANTNTPGYKYQEVVQSTKENFTMINYTGGKDGNERRVLGNWVFGNQIDELYTNMNSGTFNETNDPLDYAISGEGFFTVELNDGQRAYTRNGNFALDTENRLVTMEGYSVIGVDEAGNETDIYIDTVGRINNNAQLLIAGFPQDAEIIRMGDTLFLDPQNSAINIDNKPVNGFLEMSNVVIADEMVRLIQVAREFEASQKALHTSDETLSKAVNEIGRV